MRKTIFYLSMFLIPILFLEVVLQAYYRVRNGGFLYERMVIPIYSADKDRVYKLKPRITYTHKTNEYSVIYYTNDQGFRCSHDKKNISLSKEQNVYRILFLGSSFTFGWGNNYEDTYLSIIGANLDVPGKRVEVMNLGTPAQPIEYQLCWLKKTGYKFNPDMIVQTVYGTVTSLQTACEEPINPPVVKKGYLYLLNVPLKLKIIGFAKQSAIIFYGWHVYQYFAQNLADNIGLGTELYSNSFQDYTNYEKSAERFLEYTRIVRAVLNRDAPVVFIYIPFSYTIRPNDTSRWKHLGYINPYKLRNETDKIEKLLHKYSVPFVNPINRLISEDKKNRMYYFLDVHLTPAGNRGIAEESLPIIQEIINKSFAN